MKLNTFIKKRCLTCKKQFISYKSRKRHYCSNDCRYIGMVGKKRNPCTNDTKLKISIANKGKKRTPEQIQNIKNGMPKNIKLTKEHREKLSKKMIGKRSRGWKGGRTIDNHGYIRVYIPSHTMATKRGYVLEHRLIASKYLGRDLKKNEIVHHIDGNRKNNEITNLIVFNSIGDHKNFHNFQKTLEKGIILYLGKRLVFCVENTLEKP